MKGKMKKFGIALSSGGARGFAHIGVLQELEKNNIYPDFIAGTSMGAIVGSMYCSGLKPTEIEQMVKSQEWKKTIRPAFSTTGLVNGERIREYLKKILKSNFKKLEKDFICVSTNIKTGKKVVFREGNLTNAVYASMAVPGIFTPLEYKKMVLVDGGLVEPVPSRQLKDEGLDYIAAVDLTIDEADPNLATGESFGFGNDFMRHIRKSLLRNERFEGISKKIEEKKHFRLPIFAKKFDRKNIKDENKEKNPNVIDILKGTMYIMSNQVAVEQIKSGPHDLVIRPGLTRISLVDTSRIDDILEAGRMAVRKSLPKLKKFRQRKPSR